MSLRGVMTPASLGVMTPDDLCECGHGRWAHADDHGCLVARDPEGPYDDDCQRFQLTQEK